MYLYYNNFLLQLFIPTLTLPDTFSTFWLFPYFFLKINEFLMWLKFEKGEKKFAKRQIRTLVDRVKGSMTRFTICATESDD